MNEIINQIQTFDFAVLGFIQEHMKCGFMDFIMPKISMLGDYGIFLIALCIFFLCIKKFRKMGVVLAASLLLDFLLGNIIIKNLVARPRPYWINTSFELIVDGLSDYSFPSAHTAMMFSLAVVVFSFYRKWGIAAFAAAVLVGFSRMYLYVHNLTDVLCGMLLGILTARLVLMVYKNIEEKRKNEQSSSE